MIQEIAKVAAPVADGIRAYSSGKNWMDKRFSFDIEKMKSISDREIILRIAGAVSMIGESMDQYAFLDAVASLSDRLAAIEGILARLAGGSSSSGSYAGLSSGEVDLGAGPWYVQGGGPSPDPGGAPARISGPFMHTAANWGEPGRPPGPFTGTVVGAKQRGGEAWILNQSQTGSGWYRVTKA